MNIQFKSKYLVGISIGISLILIDVMLFLKHIIPKRLFFPLIVIGVTISWLQFWLDFFNELKRQKEMELKFLEFIRSITENIKSGISVTHSILQVKDKDYGTLSPYIKKLANQMEWGIPLHKGLVVFAKDTDNQVVKRDVAIIIEAYRSGGNIEEVLDSVALSVVNIKRMKEERKSSTYSQIVQGYIVYFVFIIIMLVLQLWLFPKITGLGGTLQSGLGTFSPSIKEGGSLIDLDFIFFIMILVQGFFAGIVIGKFSEGTIKQGMIHAIILITLATLIMTTAKGGF